MQTSSKNIYACGDINDKEETLRTTVIEQEKVAANAIFQGSAIAEIRIKINRGQHNGRIWGAG
jgi:pyruvate/2-oxoglutarate dehydrogenase complex dihydrolipoamide dehydrogenase (E3) component